MFNRTIENVSLGSTSFRSSPNLSRSHLNLSVIEQNGDYVIEQYGQPLPVQVKESFQRTDLASSAHIHPSGWCYLVTPTCFFLWRYPSIGTGAKPATKIEYPLPPNNQFSANSVALLPTTLKKETYGAIVAVSQNGAVRYWPSIGSDVSRYYDSTIDCKGMPVACQAIGAASVIVACDDSQLYRVNVEVQTHSLKLLCTRLDAGGMFAGIGKRMSSLFFGAGLGGEKVFRQLSQLSGLEGQTFLFLLISSSLQKWAYVPTHAPAMVYEAELVTSLREQAARALWPYHSDLEELADSLQLVLVDCCPFRGSLAILIATSQSEQTSVSLTSYLLALVNPQLDQLPDPLEIFSINYSTPQDSGPAVLSNRLLASDGTCCISTPHYLAVCEPPSHSVYNFDFSPPATILGLGVTPEDCPALFSRTHGILRLSSVALLTRTSAPTDLPNPTLTAPMQDQVATPVPPSRPPNRYSSIRTQRPEVLELVRQLERAMLSYVEENQMHACLQIDEALPSSSFLQGATDAVADVGVVELSRIIVNDKPASDPRWLEQIEEDLTGSLIIQHQLQHKLAAHRKFLSFLRDTGLMARMGLITYEEQVLPTVAVLCSHAEKLVSCLVLRRLHTRSTRDLVSGAIKQSLQARGLTKLIGDITPQDKFYQETEEVHTVGDALLQFELDLLTGVQGRDAYQLVSSVSTILENMLHEALLHRKKEADQFSCLLQPLPPFYDWTCSGGKTGMRTVLLKQIEVMTSYGLPFTESEEEKQSLFKLMLDMSDVILSGLLAHSNLVRGSPTGTQADTDSHLLFEGTRRELIEPFLANQQFAHATTLAEKFQDFDALISIYGKIGDKKQLSKYMAEYREHKFSDYLFKWYLDERRSSDLLAFSDTHPQELDGFLGEHPHLYWMHQVTRGDMRGAFSQLKMLGDGETRFAQKKSTLLSLSKLCVLASDEYEGRTADLEALDDGLSILSYQDQIPMDALQKEGYSPYDAPPLSCRDIVELYVNSDKNCQANIYDFLRALELVQIVYQHDVTSEERAFLILYVWSMAVMKDDWFSIPTDDPLRQIQDTTVFQIIQRSLLMDSQISTMVLDIDTLSTSPTIQEYGLAGNPNFRFLYSAGFEEFCNVKNNVTSLDQSLLFGEMNV